MEEVTNIEILGNEARCQMCGNDVTGEAYEDWSWCPHCGLHIAHLQTVAHFDRGSES